MEGDDDDDDEEERSINERDGDEKVCVLFPAESVVGVLLCSIPFPSIFTDCLFVPGEPFGRKKRLWNSSAFFASSSSLASSRVSLLLSFS